MSDRSRDAMTVLGLLPAWRLRQEFAPSAAPDHDGEVAAGSATLSASIGAVRFVVMASTPQTQTLWKQILMTSRGLSGLHEAMSQAAVFSSVQRDRLQSVLHEAPSGARFILLADISLADPFEELVSASSHGSVLRLTGLDRFVSEPLKKRDLWAQLVSLHRALIAASAE
jgi:hypothetical protein